tara:strand:- start:196 stop:495 length:300 start_codon:yes stop_codon:yes gene_type:complete
MTKYKFDDSDPTVQPVPVIITEGKYEGTKVQYGRIAFDEKDDELELNFDYRLCENPNDIEEDQEFINELGQVLVKVLEEEIEEVGEDFLRETEEEDEDS